MEEDATKKIAQEKSAEAVDAFAIAHEANTAARMAEMEAVMEKVIAKQFQVEDKEVEGDRRFINLGRVPLICQSIIKISREMAEINKAVQNRERGE